MSNISRRRIILQNDLFSTKGYFLTWSYQLNLFITYHLSSGIQGEEYLLQPYDIFSIDFTSANLQSSNAKIFAEDGHHDSGVDWLNFMGCVDWAGNQLHTSLLLLILSHFFAQNVQFIVKFGRNG
jgi:hypothetical protein